MNHSRALTRPLPASGPVSSGRAAIALCNWRDLTHPEGGGSELYVETLARGLAAAGNDVTLLCARVAGRPGDEVVDGVRYRRRGGRFTVYLHAAWALLARRVRADVVVDVQNGLPWLSRLVTCAPVVVLVHHVHREQWPMAVGRIGGRLGWWVESRVAPLLYRRARYVTVSETTRRELGALRIATERVTLVRNGTPSAAPTTAARSVTPRIVVLGRLVPHKRIEVVLRSAARLRHRWPDLQVDIAGDGWWRDQLVRLVAELRLEDNVTFHGYVDESAKSGLLASAWVNAVPSVKEGWGLTVMEAGAHRTPTVAFTHAGGLSESVRDGETGLLVDGDHEEFCAVLERLLSDPDQRTALGAAAADWAARFTREAAVSRWTRLLDDVLGGGPAGRVVPIPAPRSSSVEESLLDTVTPAAS